MLLRIFQELFHDLLTEGLVVVITAPVYVPMPETFFPDPSTYWCLVQCRCLTGHVPVTELGLADLQVDVCTIL